MRSQPLLELLVGKSSSKELIHIRGLDSQSACIHAFRMIFTVLFMYVLKEAAAWDPYFFFMAFLNKFVLQFSQLRYIFKR
jgi:hypothetical protein